MSVQAGVESPETEEGFRRLIEAVAQDVWEVNAIGEVIADSPSWRRFSGQTNEEFSGFGWKSSVHPDDLARVEHSWREAVIREENLDVECRLRDASGHYRWMNMRAAPIYGPEETIVKWIGMNIDIHSRRLAEETLRGSEEKYRTLFNLIDEGFCLIEVIFNEQGEANDLHFLETNPAFELQTGLKDSVGRTIQEQSPLLERYWFEIYGSIARTGTARRFVHRAESLGRCFDVYAFRVGEAGENRVAVLFRDISDRRYLEENAALLSEVTSSLASMTNIAATMELLAGKFGRHFKAQSCIVAEYRSPDTFVTAYEWNADRAFSRYSIQEILPDGQFAACLSGETVVVRDVASEDRDRQGRNVGSYIVVPSVREGRAVLMLAIVDTAPRIWRSDEVDLLKEASARIWASVERLHTEEALRQSDERSRLIVDNARDFAIFSMDLDRTVTSWNSGAEALLGYAQDEIVGQPADLIFSSEDRMNEVPRKEAELAILHGRASDERWHIRKNGTPFWGSGVMMAMHDAEGRTVGLVKIFRDMTETRAAQKDLEESKAGLVALLKENENARLEVEAASRAKDHFLAVLSHELRTPLAPVLLTTMTLQRRTDLAEPVVKGLEMIRRNVQLECHLIDELLDLTRIARGKLEISRDPVDLHEAICNAVDVSHPDTEFKKQQLEMNLASDRSIVIGDATRLQQLVWNLLKNASKFTPAGGWINIKTFRYGEQIAVEVTDSGAGIRQERLAAIFDAFTQAEESTFTEYGGLGLGLAIAKATVEAHGGSIQASSAGPGQGSAFIFTLPLMVEGGEKPEAAPRGLSYEKNG